MKIISSKVLTQKPLIKNFEKVKISITTKEIVIKTAPRIVINVSNLFFTSLLGDVGIIDGDRLPPMSEGKRGAVPPTGGSQPNSFLRNDGTWSVIEGTGLGDMMKAIYDSDNNGIVDAAETVDWSGVQNKPSTFPPESHDHNNLYYTKTNLQTSGQSQIHWGNITNAPTIGDMLKAVYDSNNDGIVDEAESVEWSGIKNPPTFGDMTKSIYDTNDDGIVDEAESVEWSGIQNKPFLFPPESHSHNDLYYTKTNLQISGQSQVHWENIINTPIIGDMIKSIYDSNNDGVVDAAESVNWNGIQNKPSAFPPELHNHSDLYYTKSELQISGQSQVHWENITNKPSMGDMLKSTYDVNNDGIVDAAESVDWSGIQNKPSSFPPENHNHDVRYYTKGQLNTDGESSVHWGNITNAPSFMLRSIYDSNANGVVDSAESVEWENIQNKPLNLITGSGTSDTIPKFTGTNSIENSSLTESTISNHISSTSNPHNTTATQIGLGNVTNDAQLKRADGDFNIFSEKSTPIDEDIILIEDSAVNYSKKKLSWVNIKTTLETRFNSLYAPLSRGVTNGDSHDHSGGDGAQIDHTTLSNKGINTHAQIDSFISSKGQANGLASLNSNGFVIQNPADATSTPLPSKIPIADENGKLDNWITLGASVDESKLNLSDVTTNNATTSRHGFLPKLSGDSNQYLNGNGDWSTPSSGGYSTIQEEGSPLTQRVTLNFIGEGITASDDAVNNRTNVSLNTTLNSISQLGTAANKTIYTTGTNTWAETSLTAFGRSLIDDVDASTARTTLELGSLATKNSVATSDITDSNVTYQKIQNISATNRILGRISSGAGVVEELTGTQVTSLLDVFTPSTKGLVPQSGGGTTNFLRADGTWASPGSSSYDPFLATRTRPFIFTDFWGVHGAATVEAHIPFDFVAISSGTGSKVADTANHPGIFRITSSTTANSGGRVTTDTSAFLLGGGERFEIIFRLLVASNTNTTIRMGFRDNTTSADAVDGAYFELAPGSLEIVGKTANNSTRTTSPTIATLTENTWYLGVIIVNNDATSVSFSIYSESGTLLGTQSNTTNIPTTTGRETGAGFIATNSGTTATALLEVDYLAVGYTKDLVR